MRARLPDDAPLIFKVLLGLGVGVVIAFTLGGLCPSGLGSAPRPPGDPWSAMSAHGGEAMGTQAYTDG